MPDEPEKADSPPYVAFRTLLNFLNRLGEIGTPPRVDRSVWGDTMSGAYGFQLMAALRFLGLIDADGNADSDLKVMAEDAEQRKVLLMARLHTAYAPAIKDLDLSAATMQQLQDKFRETYSVSGETFDKAISFFTHAAKAADIPLSTYIERNMKTRTATGKAKQKRKPRQAKKDTASQSSGRTPAQASGDTHERIITLKSGGSVKLVVDYNAFKLSSHDRDFVFGLIDMVQEYEDWGEAKK